MSPSSPSVSTSWYHVEVRGIEAVGRGADKGDAKRDAAKKVYEYFLENGVLGPHEEPELLTLAISIG